ncbi:MAG: hypothetical protein M3298_09850 [Thermoproteota archaeon]|nr:hypothetical protein [Thermoproteota archaeon]
MNIKTLKQLKSYENQWVALSGPDQEIVGAGLDAKAAQIAAQASGHSDVTLLRVFPLDMHYVPLVHEI